MHEEVHCQASADDGGSQNRRADIVAIDRRRDRAMILDPTLRWESNDENQDKAVNDEKRSIYLPTVPFFREKYGIANWEVFGLWFGVRGTASAFLCDFFKRFGLSRSELSDLCLTVLRDTLHIVHRHLYA